MTEEAYYHDIQHPESISPYRHTAILPYPLQATVPFPQPRTNLSEPSQVREAPDLKPQEAGSDPTPDITDLLSASIGMRRKKQRYSPHKDSMAPSHPVQKFEQLFAE